MGDEEDVADAVADVGARLSGAWLDELAFVATPRAHVAGRLFERPLPFAMA